MTSFSFFIQTFCRTEIWSYSSLIWLQLFPKMSQVVHQLVWVDILSPLVLMVVTLLIIHPFLPLSKIKQNSIVIGYLCTYEWLNLLLQSRDSILPQRWHNCTQKCYIHKVQIPSVNCKVDILFSNHENGSPELWSHWIEWILRIR